MLELLDLFGLELEHELLLILLADSFYAHNSDLEVTAEILTHCLCEKVHLLKVLSGYLLRVKSLIDAFPVLLEFHSEEMPHFGLCVLDLALDILNEELLPPLQELSLLLAKAI